jgi:hypothetical protein
MKPVARHRGQLCVLGRYSQPLFLFLSADSSGAYRGKYGRRSGCFGNGARFSMEARLYL